MDILSSSVGSVSQVAPATEVPGSVNQAPVERRQRRDKYNEPLQHEYRDPARVEFALLGRVLIKVTYDALGQVADRQIVGAVRARRGAAVLPTIGILLGVGVGAVVPAFTVSCQTAARLSVVAIGVSVASLILSAMMQLAARRSSR
jgi:hypothetical protein